MLAQQRSPVTTPCLPRFRPALLLPSTLSPAAIDNSTACAEAAIATSAVRSPLGFLGPVWQARASGGPR
eukprot:6886297-Alexandrium_andersonii.AAC.1